MPPHQQKGKRSCSNKSTKPPKRVKESDQEGEDGRQHEGDEVAVAETRLSMPTSPMPEHRRHDCEEEREEEGRPAQQEEESDSVPSNQTTHPRGSGKSKSRKVMEFDSEQEEDLVEWYQSHPEMYDYNNKNYKRTDLKNRLLQDKADEMGVMAHDIGTWYRKQRTSFTRIKSSKSGQSKKPLTLRNR